MNTIDKYTDEITFIKIIDKTIDEFIDDTITSIGNYAFSSCSSLTSVDLPKVTFIGNYAFSSCSSLTSVDLPKVTSIASNAFKNCSSLTSVDLPVVASIGNNVFYNCSSLTSVDLPVVASIASNAFYNCSQLTSVILRNTSRVTALNSTNAFTKATNAIIYVPDELVDDYKAANNWSTYADRIKGLSELPTN